jgi:peptidyl-prolyl cis-trans isomerase A (cyclophilin A)
VIKKRKKEKVESMKFVTWIYIHRILLLLCSLVVICWVWHRWSVRLWDLPVFSDSFHNPYRTSLRVNRPTSPFIFQNISVASSVQKNLKKIVKDNPVPPITMKPKQLKSEAAVKVRRPLPKNITVPYAGCITELPEIDERKHIVPPPAGDVTLVCCNTTAGVLNIEVHPFWASKGAARFLEMVSTDFFSSQVPLFRALRGFLIQFGLAGDPELHKLWHKKGNLEDDPTWLPLGPRGRSINGIFRYQKGYLGYAGAGKNSRGTQLIVALGDNQFLGGGSPWEVPWGQVVGEASMAVLDHIYTGYGEKVSQGKIMNRGMAYVKEEFPKVDVITGCHVIRENIPWNWQASSENTNLNIDISEYHITDPKPREVK